MLRDIRSWDPDIEGLVGAVSRGELSARIAAEIGGVEQVEQSSPQVCRR